MPSLSSDDWFQQGSPHKTSLADVIEKWFLAKDVLVRATSCPPRTSGQSSPLIWTVVMGYTLTLGEILPVLLNFKGNSSLEKFLKYWEDLNESFFVHPAIVCLNLFCWMNSVCVVTLHRHIHAWEALFQTMTLGSETSVYMPLKRTWGAVVCGGGGCTSSSIFYYNTRQLVSHKEAPHRNCVTLFFKYGGSETFSSIGIAYRIG